MGPLSGTDPGRPTERTGSAGGEIARDGFAVVRSLIGPAMLDDLRAACPPVPGAGVRNLLGAAPAFRRLADLPAVRGLVRGVLPGEGFVTRAILFDKTPGANWALGFHQDVVIAVARRIETRGFGPWSVKAGIHHVRPPVSILAGMVTVRIHLDDCGPENGPLEVIPGSHAHGFLDDRAVARWIASGRRIACTAGAGDVVLMRPLLLHGSRKSSSPSRRRVVQLEFVAEPLPEPLCWLDDG